MRTAGRSTDGILVPPVKIQGIKTRLIGWIGENVRVLPGAVWHEPFMGSGAVGLNLAPGKAVFSDTNPHIIALYRAIAEGEIDALAVRGFLEEEGERLRKHGEAHYLAVRERFNREHAPLDFLFLNRCCFNGVVRFNKNHAFNTPFGHNPERFSKAYVTKVVNQVRCFAERARAGAWEFHCRPFRESIAEAKAADFIYCDPPYIGRNAGYYDGWHEADETALRDALFSSKARYMVSTWTRCGEQENPYVQSVWRGCRIAEHPHRYFVGPKDSNRPSVTEALLLNYLPEENPLQDG